MGQGSADGPVPTGPKVSRRAVCGIIAGLAASAPPGLGSIAFAAGGREREDIRYVLTDKRHPESLAFAAAFHRRGVARLEVTDGLTDLWRTALVPLWSGQGGAVVGLTRRETWSCVAEQARSCRRRSVLSARHALSADGCVTEHFLSGSPSTLADAAALERCGTAWPGVAASLAMRCPVGDARTAVHGRFAGPAAAMEAAPSSFLVSWVIA